MDKAYIGQKISAIRKERGMTQKELAEKIHVTDKSVSKWETGTHFPDIAIMDDLAAALGISVAELLGLENATPEKAIEACAFISAEEKNKIKKGIRSRALMTIVCVLFLMFAEIYLCFELRKVGLIGGIYGSFTVGLLGAMGTILGGALYSLVNAKKL